MLYVVATPIGNLEDVSPRALRVLGEVALIACEDTRHSARLLAAHAIRTPTISYFEHNEERRTPELIERLGRGDSVAIITDARRVAWNRPISVGFEPVWSAAGAAAAIPAPRLSCPSASHAPTEVSPSPRPIPRCPD